MQHLSPRAMRITCFSSNEDVSANAVHCDTVRIIFRQGLNVVRV